MIDLSRFSTRELLAALRNSRIRDYDTFYMGGRVEDITYEGIKEELAKRPHMRRHRESVADARDRSNGVQNQKKTMRFDRRGTHKKGWGAGKAHGIPITEAKRKLVNEEERLGPDRAARNRRHYRDKHGWSAMAAHYG